MLVKPVLAPPMRPAVIPVARPPIVPLKPAVVPIRPAVVPRGPVRPVVPPTHGMHLRARLECLQSTKHP